MRYLNILALAVSLAMAATVGAAFADGWHVDRVTLPAVYTTDGKTWAPVTQGMSVPNASWINTGDHGRVALSRGTDTMFIGAYSLVATVERGTDARPVSDVRQPFGAVTIDLKKRGYDQMKVTTPYMAAIVKGTQFTVTARRQHSTLGVNRGLVEATDRLTGAVAEVGIGGMAEVNAANSVLQPERHQHLHDRDGDRPVQGEGQRLRPFQEQDQQRRQFQGKRRLERQGERGNGKAIPAATETGTPAATETPAGTGTGTGTGTGKVIDRPEPFNKRQPSRVNRLS